MKKIYLSILALVLVFMMALGSVSAADDATTDVADDSSSDSDFETTGSDDDSSNDSESEDGSGDVEAPNEIGDPLLAPPDSNSDESGDSSADNENGNSDSVDLSIKAGNPLLLLVLSLLSLFVIPLRK
ncbi:MAG: hypothetical protein IKV87_08585 [Methanobrevibacter sp.]|nr:hypothetical protein [Methanobrevibacter sp.]